MAGAPFKKNISFTRALSKLLHLYFTKCLIIIQNGRLHYSPPTCQSDNKSQREPFFFPVYLQHGVVIASIGKISSYNFGFFFLFLAKSSHTNCLLLFYLFALIERLIIWRGIVLIVHGWLRGRYLQRGAKFIQTFLLLTSFSISFFAAVHILLYYIILFFLLLLVSLLFHYIVVVVSSQVRVSFLNCWVGPFVCRESWRRPQKKYKKTHPEWWAPGATSWAGSSSSS